MRGSDLRIVDRVIEWALFAFLKESGQGRIRRAIHDDNGGVSKHVKAGLKGTRRVLMKACAIPTVRSLPGKFPAGGVTKGRPHTSTCAQFCELAGVNCRGPQTRRQELVPLLRGPEGARHHPYVYHTWDRYFPNPTPLERERLQRWNRWAVRRPVAADPSKWMLYDLQNDPARRRTWRSNIDKVANCGPSSFAGSTK